jgi:hypothetical protein
MSASDRAELTAFHELEQLVRHLGDELAGFRRRALLAESRVKELERMEELAGHKPQRDLAARCAALEHENASLQERLETATTRTRQMLDRVRFIRQQTQASAGGER